MGLRLHSMVTDKEVCDYIYKTDKSPLQANDEDLVWVYQYVYNNQGRWTTVGKAVTPTQVLEGWREMRTGNAAVHLERRLALVRNGRYFLINLVPWRSMSTFDKENATPDPDEEYVHILGGSNAQTAI